MSRAIRNICAIGKKQNKDTLKNKSVFLQFIIFPIMAFVMENTVEVPGMPENYFVALFAVMFLGMAPLTAMATLLSEEKEKNTLRMLKLAGVTPAEYMLGAGGYLFGICFLGAVVFAANGAVRGRELPGFLAAMAFGILISLLIGAVIGLFARNQTAAASMMLPVMMIFSFLPMIAMFDKTIERIAGFTYTGQIHRLLSQTRGAADGILKAGESLPSGGAPEVWQAVLVIGGNALAAGVLFLAVYKRKGAV